MSINADSPIIVVGPGRCGTSAVAGLLHHLGVYMGDRFYPAHKTNPYGHWEDLDFLEPNDRLVMKRSISEAEWRALVLEVIEKRKAMNRLWGWKDPRNSLLVPLYRELLPEATFVRCTRDREAIVSSFLKAYGGHGWTEPVTRRVIEQRESALDHNLPQETTLVINFDELKLNRHREVARLAWFAGAALEPEEKIQEAVDFIRTDAPHNHE